MIDLIYFEIKKITRLTFFRISCIVLLAAAIITSVNEAETDEKGIPDNVWRSFYEAYETEPEKVLNDYNEMRAHENEQNALFDEAIMLGQQYKTVPWQSRYADDIHGTDSMLFSELFKQERFIKNGYSDSIADVCEEAKKTLRSYTGKEGLYAANYQKKVLLLYEKLPEKVNMTFSHPTGWAVWFNNQNRMYFLYFALLITAVCTYGYEKGGRAILNTSRYGGAHTAAAKSIAFLVLSLFMALVFVFCSFAAVAITCEGMGDMSNAIQTVRNMAYVPYFITIGEGFALSVLFAVLSAFAFSSLCAVVCAAVQNVMGSLGGSSAVFAVCLVLTKIPGVVSRISVFSLGSGTSFFTRFRGINIFFYPASEFSVSVVLCLLITIAGSIMAAVIFTLSRSRISLMRKSVILSSVASLFTGMSGYLKNKLRVTVIAKTIFGFEALKLIRRKGAVLGLIAGLAAAFQIFFSVLSPDNSLNERIYKEYTKIYEGEVTEEKLNSITEEIAYFGRIQSYETKNRNAYESNSLSAEEYSEYLSELYKAKTRELPAKKVKARMERLIGTKGRIIYDTGILALLNCGFSPVLVILAAFAGTFILLPEYEGISDFARILKPCRNGRKKTWNAKLLTVFLICLILSLLLSVGGILYVISFYGVSDVTVPLYSLDGYRGEISIMSFIAIRETAQFAAVLAAGIMSFSIFSFFRKSIVSVLLTSGAMLLPSIITYSGTDIGFDILSSFSRLNEISLPVEMIPVIIPTAIILICASVNFLRFPKSKETLI